MKSFQLLDKNNTVRYTVAKFLYRLRFPLGGMSECDMRPTHQAFQINTHVFIKPQATAAATRDLSYKRWCQMFRWVRRIAWLFDRNDRVQMVVGFRHPPRQLLKGWAPANRFHEADPLNLDAIGANLTEMIEWDNSVAV